MARLISELINAARAQLDSLGRAAVRAHVRRMGRAGSVTQFPHVALRVALRPARREILAHGDAHGFDRNGDRPWRGHSRLVPLEAAQEEISNGSISLTHRNHEPTFIIP